ncbi:MAG: carboxylating nicotinate-nucleotide diphosphorylase [Deltaproteobacteria bacterium]|nr:carboxylating nicotinate-nucleotide diphosphorylase [Deltaproteobacteria bacterium]
MNGIKLKLQALIEEALAEDIGAGDLTTDSVINGDERGSAVAVAKQDLVVAGLHVFRHVFLTIDPDLVVEILADEGAIAARGCLLARVSGCLKSILTAERVALNFLQRLCGIATITRQFVKAVGDSPAIIVDTRKTTPGLRMIEKYAVRIGGGRNHRLGLDGGILIKDNHIKAAGGITEAVRKAKQRSPFTLKIEVEVTSLRELREALSAGADIIMLDNMDIPAMSEAVAIAGGRAIIEASGNVTIERIPEIARTGVDVISVGALTHSAGASDISLIVKEEGVERVGDD